eukprot:5424787-Alexandrium_andersonii.AAC.1
MAVQAGLQVDPARWPLERSAAGALPGAHDLHVHGQPLPLEHTVRLLCLREAPLQQACPALALRAAGSALDAGLGGLRG